MNFRNHILVASYVLLTVAIASCGENAEDADLIQIHAENPVKLKNSFKVSDVCSDIRIVPLETLPENFTNSIGEVRIEDSIIFIFDRQLKSLDLYSLEGKFIRRIRKTGRGPGEYMQPAGFEIVSERKEVLIFDWSTKKISAYSYLTGNYLREIARTPEGKPFHNFALDANQFIFISCSSSDPDDAYFIWTIDPGNNFIGKYVPLLTGENNRSINIPYTRYGNFARSENNTMKIFWPYSNTIFQNSNKGIIPYAELVSEGLLATDSDYLSLINIQSLQLDAERKIPKIFGITSYSENERYAFIVFRFRFIPYYLLYNFITGESITFSNENLINDFLEMKATNPLGIFENDLVMFIPPSSVNSLLENLQTGKVRVPREESLRLDSLIRNNIRRGEGNSNPILIFYELKK